MIFNLKGNILTQNLCKVICHQTNCISHKTEKVAGLAKSISDKWEHAHPYKNRQSPHTMGTISFVDVKDKIIIEMDAQYYPGKPIYKNDTKELRVEAFKRCLKKIVDSGIKKLAIPKNIGCGLAGGDWDVYCSILKEYFMESDIDCYIFELEV